MLRQAVSRASASNLNPLRREAQDQLKKYADNSTQFNTRIPRAASDFNIVHGFAKDCIIPDGLKNRLEIQLTKHAVIPQRFLQVDVEAPRAIQFDEILAAAETIRGHVVKTTCTHNEALSKELGMDIYFKREFTQATGSFKERGSRNALSHLSEEQLRKGVIATSSGNHALGLAYHGQKLGTKVTVIMPQGASEKKISMCRQYGATVIVHGENLEQAKKLAHKIIEEKGYTMVYNDLPEIIAGQGTMGLEIIQELGRIDAMIIPIGTGGMLAGVGLALKTFFPEVKIIGVQAERCPSYLEALKHGKPVYTPPTGCTFADGLASPTAGANSIETVKKYNILDKMVTVSEDMLAVSIMRLLDTEKTVVEGAAAAGLAAILSGQLPELKGKRVVIPLSGGNIDMVKLCQAMTRALEIQSAKK